MKKECAISGLSFNKSDMVEINGEWYSRNWVDPDSGSTVHRDAKTINWYTNYLNNNPALKPQG